MVYMGETNMTQMDDERRIIDQVRRGDTQLYARLVTRHQGPIYNLMFRMTRSEDQAFDLSQETFVRAFEKLDGFDTHKIWGQILILEFFGSISSPWPDHSA